MTRTRWLWLWMAALLVSACGVDPSATRQDGVDTSLACPEGFIGWNFTEQPPPLSGEWFQEQLGDGGALPMVFLRTVDIQAAACSGSADAGVAAAEELSARQACMGRTECAYTPRVCASGLSVTYTCGRGDLDGGMRTATVSNGKVTMTCPGTGVRPAANSTARRECIPTFCRGKTRRNAQMKCVPDTTRPVIQASQVDLTVPSFTAKYAVYEPDDQSQQALAYAREAAQGTSDVLFRNNVYTIESSLAVDASEAVKNLRVVMWFSTTWRNSSTWETADAFRCVAATFSVNKPAGYARLTLKQEGPINEACFSAATQAAGRREAMRKLGATEEDLKASHADVEEVVSRLHVSFDVEGRSYYQGAGHTEKSMCSPNPPSFFYDVATNSFDQLGFYQQRQVDDRIRGYQTSLGRHGFYFANAKRMELGPMDVSLRDPLVFVPVYSPVAATIPIDFTWYVANDSSSNLFSLDHVDGMPGPIGGAWGKEAISGTLGPPNLRATIYIVPATTLPTDPTGPFRPDYPILAEIPLTTAAPTGSTVSVDAPVTPRIKQLFFSPDSKLYIPDTAQTRRYQLLACIRADRPSTAIFETRNMVTGITPKYTMRIKDPGPSYSTDSLSVGNDADAAAAYSPYSNARPGRGCRFTKAPLVIAPDRTRRPLPPISSTAWPGSLDENTSGNSTMSGSSDNGAERTCQGTTGASCRARSTSESAADGEMARSYYATTTTTDRVEGTDLSADLTVEAVGFNVLNDGEGGEDQDPWPTTINKSTPPVTLSIEPGFDAVADRLNAALKGTPVEWESGHFAGVMGLGVGWGFKVPLQIGPIPGMITITVSVGVGVKAEFVYRFVPEEGDGYACLGAVPCFKVETTRRTHRDAARTCNLLGGRLAELKTQTEASAVDQLVRTHTDSALDEFWLGGQLAYLYRKSDCVNSWDTGTCPGKTDTTYRWLSNDQVFASQAGNGGVSWDGTKIFAGGTPALGQLAPQTAGFTYKKSGSGGARLSNVALPSVCQFDPADNIKFDQVEAALEVGVGAGVGISFCTPSEDIGICLEGSMNVVGLAISPKLTHTEVKLRDASNAITAVHSNTNFKVEWGLTLFEAEIGVKVKLFFTSLGWTLVKFDGLKVQEGELYNYDSPSFRSKP